MGARVTRPVTPSVAQPIRVPTADELADIVAQEALAQKAAEQRAHAERYQEFLRGAATGDMERKLTDALVDTLKRGLRTSTFLLFSNVPHYLPSTCASWLEQYMTTVIVPKFVASGWDISLFRTASYRFPEEECVCVYNYMLTTTSFSSIAHSLVGSAQSTYDAGKLRETPGVIVYITKKESAAAVTKTTKTTTEKKKRIRKTVTKDDDDEDEDECIVCMEPIAVDGSFFKCTHRNVCLFCSVKLHECPSCRAPAVCVHGRQTTHFCDMCCDNPGGL